MFVHEERIIIMNKKLKILIVGGGSAGVRHFSNLSDIGATCSVSDPKADCLVMKKFPDAEYFVDFEQVELGGFDCVVMCTPPVLHVPQALAAARAGCHVLLEKPLSALNEDGIDELEAVLKEKNLVGGVAFPYANMKAMDRIIEIVKAGEIGKIRSISVHEGQNLLKYRPDLYQTYYISDAQGAGCLQDDAMHPLMGLEMLLGEELEVSCQRHCIGYDKEKIAGVDDTAWLWLRYAEDVVVAIDFSLMCHWEHDEWIIGADDGAIRLDVVESKLEIFDAKTEQVRVEEFDDDWDETFRRNDENFVAAIEGSAALKCTIEMGRINLRAVLAARRSAETGTMINVSDMQGNV